MKAIKRLFDANSMQPFNYEIGCDFRFNGPKIKEIKEVLIQDEDGQYRSYYDVYDEDYNLMGRYHKTSMNVEYV